MPLENPVWQNKVQPPQRAAAIVTQWHFILWLKIADASRICARLSVYPGSRRDEVEIVRIELDSTTSDVISLRTRPIGRARPQIAYSLVDEYQTEYGIRPARTARPLTLGQLITLLDNVHADVTEREWLRHGWVLSLNESNRTLDNGDPEPYRNFTSLSSELYPELSKHYERLFDRWAQTDRRTDEESDA